MLRAAAAMIFSLSLASGLYLLTGVKPVAWAEPLALALAGTLMAAASFFVAPRERPERAETREAPRRRASA